MTAIDQVQLNLHHDTVEIILLQHRRVPTPKRMENAQPPNIGWMEPDQNNLEYDSDVMCVVWVVLA